MKYLGLVLALVGSAGAQQTTIMREIRCKASGGTSTAYACSSLFVPISYQSGNLYKLYINVTNTGSSTVAFNGLSAVPIKKVSAGSLVNVVAGDLLANTWVTFLYESPNMQLLAGAGGSGGSNSSVFDGSTATAPAHSATPTFSLANVSSKSPKAIEPGAMTGNITSVTFTNKTAGAEFSIAWLQDGTGGRTVAYGGSASGTCEVVPDAGVTTVQGFRVKSDGTTVVGTGCSTDADGVFVKGSVSGVMRINAPATGGGLLVGPAGNGTLLSDASSILAAQMGGGTADNSTVLYGDKVWRTPPAGNDIFDFSSIQLVDRFCAGVGRAIVNNKAVGTYFQWFAGAGAGAATDSGSQCGTLLTTGGNSGDDVVLVAAGIVHNFGTTLFNQKWRVRALSATTGVFVAVGLHYSGGELFCIAGSSRCSAIVFDPAVDSHIAIRNCDGIGPGCTFLASSVVFATSTTYDLRLWSTVAGTIRWSINGVEQTAQTGNVYVAAGMSPGATIRNTTAAVHTIVVDAFAMSIP